MENQKQHRKQQNRGRAAVVCALALAALGGAGAGAHAAPTATAGGHSAGEVDRNMLKPPPGGVLAPVTDLAGGLLPR